VQCVQQTLAEEGDGEHGSGGKRLYARRKEMTGCLRMAAGVVVQSLVLAVVLALALATPSSHADVLTLSTTNPGGLAHSIGSAIAKVVSETTDLRMVVVPNGGSPMPAVAGGEAECGINPAYDVSYYVNGEEIYAAEGGYPSLRMAGTVLPSLVTLYVAKDSRATAVTDLRGLRVPSGLNAQFSIGRIYETFLALGGLSRNNVASIPATTIVQAADDFAAGRNDAFLFSVGTAKVLEIDSTVGGLRALTVEDTASNRTILGDYLPGAYFTLLQPDKKTPQIAAPTHVITFDMVIFCHADVPNDIVAKILAAVHDHQPMLADSFKAMSRFAPGKMATPVPGVEFHAGALKYYRQIGLAVDPAGNGQ
jgi:TRAP transporter TAXI family solute receptor